MATLEFEKDSMGPQKTVESRIFQQINCEEIAARNLPSKVRHGSRNIGASPHDQRFNLLNDLKFNMYIKQAYKQQSLISKQRVYKFSKFAESRFKELVASDEIDDEVAERVSATSDIMPNDPWEEIKKRNEVRLSDFSVSARRDQNGSKQILQVESSR